MRCAVFLALLPIAAWAQDRDWAALDRQAEQLYVKGDLKEAIRVAKLAVDAAPDPQHSARSLDRLGFFEYTSGDMRGGESHLRAALEIRAKAGEDTLDYAESANDLALACRDAAKLPEARTLGEQAVAIRTRLTGPKDLRVAESLNTLGSILGLMGEYDLAISRFEEAVAIHEARKDPADLNEEYGTLLINLAGTYQRAGKYSSAETAFQKGLDVLRKNPGVNHPAYSASLVAYAYLQADLGHYSIAEKVYEESGRLLREQLGEAHPAYAAFLNNRAALYTALGNTKVAEADYRKALELKRRLYGPDALTVGASLRNLARLEYAQDPKEGERLFEETANLYAKNPKPPPFDYASALLGLGDAQRDRGDLAKARQTLERALQVASTGLGAKHPMYAAALSDLALVHLAAREYSDAEALLKQSAAIIEETRGPDHPDLAQALARLASCYDAAGDFQQAGPLYRRSLEISDRALGDMLMVGSEANKSAALAVEDPLPLLIGFARRAGGRFPDARVLAFEAVARRKGRVLDQVHDWSQSLRAASDPSVRRRFDQWKAMLQCEASLALATGYRDLKTPVIGTCSLKDSELEGRYEKLLHDLRANWTEPLGRQAAQASNVLKQRVDALEASLSREIPRFNGAGRLTHIADIRARLNPGELLVEFVEYGAGAAKHYGAFLLDRGDDLQWIELGPAAEIDTPIQDLITAANDWSVSVSRGEKRSAGSSTRTAQDALDKLSQKLRPVLDSIARRNGLHQLRIAPDGLLNLLPFAALRDGRGLLIEHFAISYLAAGRDLAEAAPQPATGAIVIAMSPGGQEVHSSSFRAERLERLEGAAIEARDLQRRMPRAILLGEGQATEQRIKKLARPALLHIVGHGIIKGREDLEGNDAAAHAMSLSAIVLEEAYGRGAGSPQDGLLTALELQTLDLEGTEMLVLSQCRMADGVPSTGNGVFGMRRAAAIAGVKTFVAPLWNVADASERVLMDRFYRELASGAGRAEALRRAQLQLLRNATGFLEWAPVILSGDSSPLPAKFFTR